MRTFDVIVTWWGGVASLAALLIYALRARWWTNPVGFVLVLVCLVSTLLYARPLIGLAIGIPLAATLFNVIINCVVAGTMTSVAGVFAWLTRTKHTSELPDTKE